MTKEQAIQALQSLYGATRAAPLTADQHEALYRLYHELAAFVNPLPSPPVNEEE